MGRRPYIKVPIDEDQLEDIREYAKAKGFDTPQNLARVAIFNYMARNKMSSGKNAHRCTAEKPDE